MKKTLLVNVSYYIEINEDEYELATGIQNQLCENRLIESDGEKVFLKWNQSSFKVLYPDIMNCGKCTNCGCWTTDMEKINSIFGLDRGAVHNNKLLCDECLPPDHRWAF